MRTLLFMLTLLAACGPDPNGVTLLDADGDGYSEADGDCDDGDADRHPGADELCNGVDDDCDGVVDPPSSSDASSWYNDRDGDGYGEPTYASTSCEPNTGQVADHSDCDDGNANVNPGVDELCNGVDDDCDGDIDPATAVDADPWFTDGDGDGYGDPTTEAPACEPSSDQVADGTDCDDGDASIHPNADETCNGVDDDCDSDIDPGSSVDAPRWHPDADGDGYGDADSFTTACSQPSDTQADDSDCDDGDPAINPEGTERCNGVDDDCDGEIDPDTSIDASTWYTDRDGDGYGDPATAATACAAASDQVADNTDCDDATGAVNPGVSEMCNGVDDDCDGDVDPDTSLGTRSWYDDDDGDGYGDSSAATTACAAASGQVSTPGDCDDADSAIHPAATELCNGIDDDCDGSVDPGTSADATTWYTDSDDDGYGDPATAASACAATSGQVADDSDCDDGDAAIHPAATELCNATDDDCDGIVDPSTSADATTWYDDADGDGYGDPSTAATACAATSGQVADSSDCDDTSAAINPGATELCNGVDDDCDGDTDPVTSADATTWYGDADGDGYGDPTTTSTACTGASDQVATGGDCDDTSAAVNPAATESCNGIDDDCDGDTDPSTSVDAIPGYLDADGDGYGDSSTVSAACTLGSGLVADGGDCDDTDPDISPGAAEWCGDGVDQDCDGVDTGDGDCAPTGTTSDEDAYISGSTTTPLGESLTIIPDSTGDGWGEIIVGAPEGGSSAQGVAYLFSAFPEDDISRGVSGADHVFYGDDTDDLFGTALAGFPDRDGDGLSELLAGGPGDDGNGSAAGAVWLFQGPLSTSSSSHTSAATVTLYGENAGDAAGTRVANGGDLDGDGYDDMLISAPGWDGLAGSLGAIYVAFADAPGSGTLTPGDQARIVGERAGDALQVAAALGDMDGDGYDDLGIGCPNGDELASSAGSAWVMLGPLSVTHYEVAAAALRIDGEGSSDAFGAGLVAGDVDGDGQQDLWVGATGTDDGGSNAGSVALYYGPLPRGRIDADEASTIITGSDRYDAVGDVLGTGDLDADGWSDLILGVPGADLLGSGVGGAFVFYGTITSSSLELADADATLYGSTSSQSGAGLLVADVSEDGFDDVAVLVEGSYNDRYDLHLGGLRLEDWASAPDTSTDDDGDGYSEADGDCDDGRASRSPGLTEVCGEGGDEDCDGYADRCAPDATLSETDLEILVPYDLTTVTADFGAQVRSVGDVNGDGVEDAAIQDETWDSDSGRVLVFFGPVPTGTLDAGDADVDIQGNYPGDVTGTVMTNAGDLDGDGYDELFIGSPEGSWGASADGFASIFRGGPTLYGSLLVSDADWTIYGASDDREVGYGCGGDDLDADGYDDLVIVAAGDDAGSLASAGTLKVINGPLATGVYTFDDLTGLQIQGSLAAESLGKGTRPWGDLTGDGIDDLLVWEPGWHMHKGSSLAASSRFMLFEGPLATSGTLDEQDALTIIGSPQDAFETSWTIADLTGDGLPDMVIGSDEDTWAVLELSALRGLVEIDENLTASFFDPSGRVHTNHHELAAGDIDRDGIDDLVLGYATSSTDNGELAIFYGPLAGDVSLAWPDLLLEGDDDHVLGASIDVGDFDGDGFDDVIMGLEDYGSSREHGAFAVLRGGWSSATESVFSALDPDADDDGDGYAPTAGDCHDGDASIHPGATEICGNALDEDCDGVAYECAPVGDRTDHLPSLMIDGYNRGMDYYVRSLGDIDGDGRSETVVVDNYYDLAVMQSPLPRSGTVEASDYAIGPFLGGAGGAYSVTLVPDVDSDGIPEFLTPNGSGNILLIDSAGGLGSRSLTTAAWTFTEASSVTTFGGPARGGPDAFGWADATIAIPDQSSDLAYTNAGAVYLFGITEGGGGAYTGSDAELIITGEAADEYFGAELCVPGDLDGDGMSEVAFSTSHGSYSTDELSYVWRSDGSTGTISALDLPIRLQDRSSYTRMEPWAPGDLDADGLNDLAFAYPDHTDGYYPEAGCVYLWSGVPADGDHYPPNADLIISGDASSERLGDGVGEQIDLDADGYLDLVVGAPHTYSLTPDGRVYVWYGPMVLSGTMTGSTDADGIIYPEDGWEEFGGGIIAAGDVDGDGYEDFWTGVDDVLCVLIRGGMR